MPATAPKSWSSTLRLPKSSFPPRPTPAHFARYLKRCTDHLYKWQAQSRSHSKPFVLHDGPPYANGSLHCGHAINKILKDMICRAELHQGRRVKYVPGWDCHGLPIEVKALEKHRDSSDHGEIKLDAIGIRKIARTLANKTVEKQMKDFQQWAVMADWKSAWKTMDKTFEMKQLGVFREMVKKGLIFRRFKPVYWSPSSCTALAEAELEYKDDHESTAAYIKFPISTLPKELQREGVDVGKLSAVIWTTTPWTLPANRAIAVHNDLEYAIVESGKDQLLIAKSRLLDVAKLAGFENSFKVIIDIKGSELCKATYINHLRGKQSTPQPIIVADFVSADSGTGLVHCAPGHGMEDYDVCTKQRGIPAFAPVNDAGCFTDRALPDNPAILAGISVLDGGSAKVLDLMGNQVLAVHKYKHKYPYDWRTKLPVIVRATEQWFADVGSIKDDALKALTKVKFIPESGRARLESFVKGRSEWCISRQRAWGVPIPALYNEHGKAILDDKSVAHIISMIEERGIDAWWTDAPDDPAWIVPGLDGSYTRGMDTMDVWFDSGSSWTQTPEQADVYIEGTDQHRGWFQSSLLTHICASEMPNAPFKTLITHGFTLDQEGKKMSKSIGNTIAPEQIMDGSLLPPVKRKGKGKGKTADWSSDRLGTDALRLWVANSDYTRDVVISQPVLQTVHTSLLKYRTTIKMLLGSMQKPSFEMSMTKLDLIALYQLDIAVGQVRAAWQNYEFHKAVSIINRWINVDLSSFYLEAIKDRVYCGDGGGVLFFAFQGLLQMLSPITPILVEEAWDHRPQWMQDGSHDHVYPFHTKLGQGLPWISQTDATKTMITKALPWLLHANTAIKTAQEKARAQKLIGSSLESSVVLLLPEESMPMFQQWEDELQDVFVVSSVELNGAVEDAEWQFAAEFDSPGGKGMAIVMPPKEAKCPRCWKYVAPKEDVLCKRCDEVVAGL